jgi:hypothetical protein
MRKTLPRELGTYRIINTHELTEADRALLRQAGQARVRERICSMIANGTLSASQVQRRYGALMREVGIA